MHPCPNCDKVFFAKHILKLHCNLHETQSFEATNVNKTLLEDYTKAIHNGNLKQSAGKGSPTLEKRRNKKAAGNKKGSSSKKEKRNDGEGLLPEEVTSRSCDKNLSLDNPKMRPKRRGISHTHKCYEAGCKATFWNKRSLVRHERTLHKKYSPKSSGGENPTNTSLKEFSHDKVTAPLDVQNETILNTTNIVLEKKVKKSTDRKDPSQLPRNAPCDKQTLKIHSSLHVDERPYKCIVVGCKATYKNKNYLTQHEKLAHKPDLNLSSNNEIQSSRSRTPRNKFSGKDTCSASGKETITEKLQKGAVEERTALIVKRKKCPPCTRCLLKMHCSLHEERSFKCDEQGCKAVFPNKVSLMYHKKILHYENCERYSVWPKGAGLYEKDVTRGGKRTRYASSLKSKGIACRENVISFTSMASSTVNKELNKVINDSEYVSFPSSVKKETILNSANIARDSVVSSPRRKKLNRCTKCQLNMRCVLHNEQLLKCIEVGCEYVFGNRDELAHHASTVHSRNSMLSSKQNSVSMKNEPLSNEILCYTQNVMCPSDMRVDTITNDSEADRGQQLPLSTSVVGAVVKKEVELNLGNENSFSGKTKAVSRKASVSSKNIVKDEATSNSKEAGYRSDLLTISRMDRTSVKTEGALVNKSFVSKCVVSPSSVEKATHLRSQKCVLKKDSDSPRARRKILNRCTKCQLKMHCTLHNKRSVKSNELDDQLLKKHTRTVLGSNLMHSVVESGESTENRRAVGTQTPRGNVRIRTSTNSRNFLLQDNASSQTASQTHHKLHPCVTERSLVHRTKWYRCRNSKPSSTEDSSGVTNTTITKESSVRDKTIVPSDIEKESIANQRNTTDSENDSHSASNMNSLNGKCSAVMTNQNLCIAKKAIPSRLGKQNTVKSVSEENVSVRAKRKKLERCTRCQLKMRCTLHNKGSYNNTELGYKPSFVSLVRLEESVHNSNLTPSSVMPVPNKKSKAPPNNNNSVEREKSERSSSPEKCTSRERVTWSSRRKKSNRCTRCLLKMHCALHEERFFKCIEVECDATFFNKAALAYHVKTVHCRNLKPFSSQGSHSNSAEIPSNTSPDSKRRVLRVILHKEMGTSSNKTVSQERVLSNARRKKLNRCTKCQLKMHCILHDKRLFHCTVLGCKAAFKAQQSLAHHTKTVHGN